MQYFELTMALHLIGENGMKVERTPKNYKGDWGTAEQRMSVIFVVIRLVKDTIKS